MNAETHKSNRDKYNSCYLYGEKCAENSFINLFQPRSGCATTIDAGLTKPSETHKTCQCWVGLQEMKKNRTYLINLCKLSADVLELLQYTHTAMMWMLETRNKLKCMCMCVCVCVIMCKKKLERQGQKKLYQLQASYFNNCPIVPLTVVLTVICAKPRLEFPSFCGEVWHTHHTRTLSFCGFSNHETKALLSAKHSIPSSLFFPHQTLSLPPVSLFMFKHLCICAQCIWVTLYV